MLVQFTKRFIIQGEAIFKEKPHWYSKKKIEKVYKIYSRTWVSGICDESEVEAEVARLEKHELETTRGWGYKFLGWKKILTYEEALAIATKDQWDKSYSVPTGEVRIERFDDMKVAEVAKMLNGTQFAQYCKDYGIRLE